MIWADSCKGGGTTGLRYIRHFGLRQFDLRQFDLKSKLATSDLGPTAVRGTVTSQATERQSDLKSKSEGTDVCFQAHVLARQSAPCIPPTPGYPFNGCVTF